MLPPPMGMARTFLHPFFSFSIARKLLECFEGTPLALDMRSVLSKIADSLRGTVSLELDSLTPVHGAGGRLYPDGPRGLAAGGTGHQPERAPSPALSAL